MPTIDMTATGARIRQLRKKAHMTIADLQAVCGVSGAAIGKWQRGDAVPTVDNLVVLAAAWGVKIDDIVMVMTPRP